MRVCNSKSIKCGVSKNGVALSDFPWTTSSRIKWDYEMVKVILHKALQSCSVSNKALIN